MDGDQQPEEGWIVVKSRKRKHIEKEVKPGKVFAKGGSARFSKEVNVSVQEQFLAHPHTALNMKTVSAALKELQYKKISVSCLGIGNFLSFLKPQLQMLFLRHCIMAQLSQMLPFEVNIYDPAFSGQQAEEVRSMGAGCSQLINFEGGRSYVLYMPHCDRFLYERVCELKSKQADCQVIVIGNSINEYKERCLLTSELIPEVLRPFSPFELKIKDYKEAFNDTFLYIL